MQARKVCNNGLIIGAEEKSKAKVGLFVGGQICIEVNGIDLSGSVLCVTVAYIFKSAHWRL